MARQPGQSNSGPLSLPDGGSGLNLYASGIFGPSLTWVATAAAFNHARSRQPDDARPMSGRSPTGRCEDQERREIENPD